MRALVAAPILCLSLLGCAQPQYLLSERTDAAPAATTSTLDGVAARYTNHPAGTVKSEVVALRIADGFSAFERGRILAAANEWNHALNGAVRFEFVTATGAVPGGWTIHRGNGAKLAGTDGWTNPQPMAATVRFPSGGGLIAIYSDRLGSHDLRGVMVHELGIALGGGGGPTLYTSQVQDCIDKDMATMVGAVRNIPVARLNWCEVGASNVAAR
jgi:hypothetical protein